MLENGEKAVLLVLREQMVCDLGRKGRLGPALTAAGSHTNETILERENRCDDLSISLYLKYAALERVAAYHCLQVKIIWAQTEEPRG